ncbi:PREDICTED: exocyst complex component EXO70A1-like [Tarenaya hassleriana]|uniref:exocyst complex component EXO70A1-like n=1 Tax=Tarenaya hassleriana TaxID=28532 RepID=UPI00053C3C61|nr:PREDICTED: exocyst complex component EXO70A1-like [Tarenaya hassleriana]
MRSLCCVSKTPENLSQSIPRRSSESPAIDDIIESATEIIQKWNTESSTFARVTSLFYESKREAMEFIERVKDLQKTMILLVSQDSNSEKLVRAQNLMQIAMKRLQKEFYQILSMNRAHLDPESVSTRSSLTSTRSSTSDFPDDDDATTAAEDSIIEVEEVSTMAMADLKSIAECMIASGYAKECVSIYKSIRKSIVDEGIYRLGVEKTSLSKMKKSPWEVAELKIKCWVDAVNVSMKTLFNGERILCDHVFESSDSLRESCFSDISRAGALLLFGFPETVAVKGKKNSPPEKIFRLLDMYSAIADNWKEIESIFSFESISMVRTQALNSLIRLGDSIRSLLEDFESGIQKDSSKTVVSGGGVHPLTISTMNYLSLLSDYNTVLADILIGSPPPEKSLLPESYFDAAESDDSPASQLTVRIAWLILVLLCKVDHKAKHYKDLSLQYLFLANNLQHTVSRVRSSNLRHLLGDDWVARHFSKARQFAASYERLAWVPVASSLPEISVAAAMSPEEVQQRFETFSTSFESAYRKQSACIVPDANLRDELKTSIARKLLPVYREFYYRHRNTVVLAGGENRTRNTMSVVRFTPEDIGNCLSDLFFEKGTLGNLSAPPSPSPSSSSPASPSHRRPSRS